MSTSTKELNTLIPCLPNVPKAECLNELTLQTIETKDGIHKRKIQEDMVKSESSSCCTNSTNVEVELNSDHQPCSTAKTRDDVVTPPLPEGCKPLSHQVAGHMHGKGRTKIGKF